MAALRKADQRGHFDHGWLDTYHSFSFADYHDPAQMGFRTLRVINDDTVAPGKGFGMHGHKDMEIITYVIRGALSHQDSMGNARTVKAGEVQAMSAGTGIRHSEFNASESEPVRLLQIWILPHTERVTPAYSEWYPSQAKPNTLNLAVSANEPGTARIHQDARMYVGIFDKETTLELPLDSGRSGWVQMAEGSAELNGIRLGEGDGISFAAEDAPRLTAQAGATLLFFDLA